MKAVILAGGEGKRLRPLTDSIPKPLVKIGDKAIIDYQIERFRGLGIADFVVLGGYKSDKLREHFSSHEDGVTIVVEDAPRGTAGAIRAARNAIGDEEFMAINGDIMTDIDLSSMVSADARFKAKIALVPMVSPFGIVNVLGNQVCGFVEKPILEGTYINAGIYWFGRGIFDYLPENGSLESAVFPKLAEEGDLGFSLFDLKGRFWRSIDTVKDYEEACKRFAVIEKIPPK